MAIKKNVIKTDLCSYKHYIRGVKKAGKSTMFRDIVLEEYGTEDAGVLCEFGGEDGHLSLDRLTFEVFTEVDMVEDANGDRGFIQFVDDMVANAGKNGIKLIGLDTIDQMINVFTKKIMQLSARETGKPCKSLNDAFGGLTY